MIQFQEVSKSYSPNCYALKKINFNISNGEMIFITGHSGSGKSTVLKLISLAEKPTHGKILVGKQNIFLLPKQVWPVHRRRLGIIHQHPNLINSRNIFENIALPLIFAKINKREITIKIRQILDKVGLSSKIYSYPEELSLSEKQRACIARALISKPDILLADEPTGNLDPALAFETIKLISEFNKTGSTILIASHDLNILTKMKHKIITLQDGLIIG